QGARLLKERTLERLPAHESWDIERVADVARSIPLAKLGLLTRDRIRKGQRQHGWQPVRRAAHLLAHRIIKPGCRGLGCGLLPMQIGDSSDDRVCRLRSVYRNLIERKVVKGERR